MRGVVFAKGLDGWTLLNVPREVMEVFNSGRYDVGASGRGGSSHPVCSW